MGRRIARRWPASASALYRQQKLVHIRSLIDACELDALLGEIFRIEPRRANIPTFPILHWESRDMPWWSCLGACFLVEPILSKVCDSLCKSERRFRSGQMWAHVFRPGEWIPPHQDRGGECQLLVCVENAFAEGGGTFLVEMEGRLNSFELRPGDAILFEATKYVHRTTPISPVEEGVKARRVTFVVRYYFD